MNPAHKAANAFTTNHKCSEESIYSIRSSAGCCISLEDVWPPATCARAASASPTVPMDLKMSMNECLVRVTTVAMVMSILASSFCFDLLPDDR